MEKYEKEHLEFVLQNAGECTVLLKYDGMFPLKNPGEIAAYGAGLRYTVKGGTGSGEVNSRFTYTIEEGLEKEGFTVVTKDWLDAYDEVRRVAKKEYYKQLKAEAKEKHENPIVYTMGKTMSEPNHDLTIEKKGDTAIYVVSRNSGEGSDREVKPGDVLLNETEIRDILTLNQLYERFMLVLNVGGVVDLSPVMEVKNILLLSQLGVDCGKVLADILTGKQNPSGKLTTTWAKWDDYSKEGTFGDYNETLYTEGIYVGYRYFDTWKKKPLFPFGYGLSFTQFEHKVKDVAIQKDEITIKADVTNAGKYAGKEVLFSFISLPDGKLDKASRELAGFAKTPSLEPGKTCEVSICFKLADFASYDEESASYILEKGETIVSIGNGNSEDTIVAVVSLDETVVTRKTRNCLGRPSFKDVEAPKRERLSVPADAVRLRIDDSDIACTEVFFDKEYEIDEKVKKLTDEELVFLEIGNFDPNAKGLSIIGNAATHVAGAAGETTSQLENKGISPLIMADGPAGIRVAKQYYEEDGKAYDADNNGMIPQSMLEMMNPVAKFIAKKLMGGHKMPKDVVVKEHAATMIPIGTAIAQSFNMDLAEKFGDIVGSEMELMDIHLWLAPALNIHRSILCGRNFEYYSEDPLISGKVAAAITKGVQKHKGCGTTIKHYAANNAETNRYCNNSQVSERAMREIYLRGFEIAVKESQPKAVMTSYNLLNGTHTSEHRGLIEDILRCEYGY